MDGRWFDAGVRALASEHGRQAFLRGLLGAAAVGALTGREGAAGEPCSGDHLECPRKELRVLDDAGRLACAQVGGHRGERLCKSPP